MLMESLRDFFDSIDEDGSGSITCDELAEAMRNMGQVLRFNSSLSPCDFSFVCLTSVARSPDGRDS
jgi:hypothetical protein